MLVLCACLWLECGFFENGDLCCDILKESPVPSMVSCFCISFYFPRFHFIFVFSFKWVLRCLYVFVNVCKLLWFIYNRKTFYHFSLHLQSSVKPLRLAKFSLYFIMPVLICVNLLQVFHNNNFVCIWWLTDNFIELVNIFMDATRT